MGRAALLLGASLAATACGGEPARDGHSGGASSGGESASADPTAPTRTPTTPPAQPGPPEDDDGGVVALYGAPSD